MNKKQRITAISLIIGGVLPLATFGGLVQVGNTVSQSSAGNANTSCAVTFSHAFYEGQSFKVYEALTPNTLGSSREILDASNARIYNPFNILGNTSNGNSLGGLLPAFTYKSNSRPGTTHFNFGGAATVVAYKQDSSTYAVKPSPNTSRTSIAAQVNHNLYRRQIQSWGSTTNIYTMSYVDLNNVGGSFTANPSAFYGTQSDYECQNFYIAKCGDGVRDNPNKPGDASTNGKNGILLGGQIIPRSTTINPPAEDCDGTDGVTAGYSCTPDCKILQQPTCTLLPPTQNILAGQSATLNYSSTNTISISNLTNIIAGTITPNTVGSFSVSPIVNTTYSFTANGAAGTTPVTCTATVTVQPIQQPTCILEPSQTIIAGQQATLNFNSTNTTSISNLVHIGAGIINPNQAGFFVVSPTTTTTYSFTVSDGFGTTPQTCTATITVQPNPEPACTLGPSQTIIAGQQATLNFNSTNTTSITNLINIGAGIINPNQAGFFVVSPTTTTTYSFTVSDGFGTTPQTCTATVIVQHTIQEPILTIHKTLLHDILYQSGDLVGRLITFANTGNGTAHNVILTDYLPVSLGYVSSQIFGVNPGYTFSTGMFGPNFFVQYSSFDLAPGQTGYMIITGQLLDYALCNQTMNTSWIQSDEIYPPLYSPAIFSCYAPDTNLTITKTVNSTTFYTGDHVNFTITVTNNGPSVASSVTIGDIRPNPLYILPGSSITSTVPFVGTNPWTLINTLPVGQSATFFLNAQIANTALCTSYTNIGTLNYIVNGQTKTGQSAVNFNVLCPSSNNNQCKKLTSYDNNVIIGQLNDNSNEYEGHAAFHCESTPGIANTIVIDCGNGEIHTGYGVDSYNATCDFSEDEDDLPADRYVTCYVDGQTQNDCKQHMIIDKGLGGYCGDGILSDREKCDLGDNDATIHEYLDAEHDVDADEYANKGYYCHNCDIKKNHDEPVVGMAACFSINNNSISLQENEILPFWRKIDTDKHLTNSCSSSNSAGKILKSSLMCEFRLFNGVHQESDGYSQQYALTVDGEKTITLPCDTDMRTTNHDFGDPLPIFDYFYNQRFTNNIRSLQDPFGRYYIKMDSNILNNGGDDDEKTYGEYNLALYSVHYDYCDANGDEKEGTPIDRVCEVDFSVTKPYLAQKSSFGLTKSTTINLDGYKDIFGNNIIKGTDLEDIMVLKESEYAGGSTIKSLMTSFINKYEKLAIYVKKITVGSSVYSVYKVPSQNIFVFKGQGELPLNEDVRTDFTTPFTMIVDGINLVVKGSLKNTNGMFLVKGGTIKFEEPDAPGRCAQTQTVQGIFVTDQKFVAGSDLANDGVTKTRCPFGGLYVKGVLIGDGIQDLVQSRRSQLNHRFIAGSSDEASIKAERRNEIFNGAAVLIEYSPSLRNKLPPGASEFTKALDVYKK